MSMMGPWDTGFGHINMVGPGRGGRPPPICHLPMGGGGNMGGGGGVDPFGAGMGGYYSTPPGGMGGGVGAVAGGKRKHGAGGGAKFRERARAVATVSPCVCVIKRE